MKKSRLNSLLAAGFMAILAPGAANAYDFTGSPITTDVNLSGTVPESDPPVTYGNSTFNAVTPSAGSAMNITTGAYTFTGQPVTSGETTVRPTITMNGSTLNFTDAINDITVNYSVTDGSTTTYYSGYTNVTGTGNQINQSQSSAAQETYGTTGLGIVNVGSGSDLTVNNSAGNSLNATRINLGNQTTEGGATGGATLKIDGNSVVTVLQNGRDGDAIPYGGVNVVGQGNNIEVTNTAYEAGALNTIRLANNASANLTGVKENVRLTDTATSGTVNVNGDDLSVTLGAGQTLNVNANAEGAANSTINGISMTAGTSATSPTTLSLNATTAQLSVTSSTPSALAGNSAITVGGTQAVTFTNGVSVSGTGNIITNTNTASGTNFGTIALASGSSVNATGLNTTNSSFSYTGTTTTNLNGSTVAGPNLTVREQNVTLNATGNATSNVSGNMSIANASDMTLSADSGSTLNASNSTITATNTDGYLTLAGAGRVNTGSVTLSDNAHFTTTNTNSASSVNGINVTGSASVTTNGTATLGTIATSGNGTVLTLSGLGANDTLSLGDGTTVQAGSNTNIGAQTLSAGETNTYTGTSAGSITMTSLTLNAGTAGDVTTANLNANGGAVSVTGSTALNGNSAVNLQGPSAATLSGATVSGTNNTISGSGTGTNSTGNITYGSASGNALTLSSSSNLTAGTVAVQGNTLTTTGTGVSTGAVSLNGGTLTNQGSGSISGVNVSGESSVNANSTTSLGIVSLADGTTLNLSGFTAQSGEGGSVLSYGSTSGGTVRVNANGSNLGDVNINNGQNVTLNSTSTSTNTTVGTSALTNSSNLTLSANSGTTLEAGTASVTNSTLVTSGDGTVNIANSGTTPAVSLNGGTLTNQGSGSISGVNVSGNSTINANSTTTLGTVSVADGANARVSNVTAGTNVTGFTLGNNSTITALTAGENLGNLSVAAGNTDTVSGTTGTTYVGTATQNAGSTLNLNTSASGANLNVTTDNMNASDLNITGSGATTVGTIGLTGANTIDNTSSNAATLTVVNYNNNATLTTTGSHNITTMTAGTGNTLSNAGTVTVGNLNVANGAEFGVTATGGSTTINNVSSATSGASKNLNLNANGGTINVGSGLDLTGSNDVLTLRGNNAITLADGVSSSSTSTINNANANSDLGNINVAAQGLLNINATAATSFDSATLEQGSAATQTRLVLNANGGNITGADVTMNGNGSLTTSGSSRVTLNNGIAVNDTGNTITAGSGSGSNLGTVTMGNTAGVTTAGVTVNGLHENAGAGSASVNFNGFNFADENAADTNTIRTANSDLGDLDLTKSTQTLTVTSTSGTNTFSSADLAAGSSFTLENSGGTLTGREITMNGSNTVGISATSGSSDTVSVLNVNGTGNSVSGAAGTAAQNKIGAVSFGADDLTLSMSNITVTGTSNVATDNNTFNTSNTTFNALNVMGSDSTLNMNATGDTTVTSAAINSGNNLEVNTSSGATSTYSSLNMNGGGSTASFSGAGTNAVTALGVTSSTNNVVNNGSNPMSIGAVSYNNNGASVAFDGDVNVGNLNLSGATNNITNDNDAALAISDINQATTGNNTLNMNGDFDVQDVNINGTGTLTLRAQTGDTEIDNFVKASSNPNMNLVLNASNGASITKTTATTLNNGDTLTMSGAGSVAMNGGVNAEAGSTLNNYTASTSLGTLTLGAGTVYNTSVPEISGPTTINNTTCDNLVLQSSSSAGTTTYPTWRLDYTATQDIEGETVLSPTADTITVTGDGSTGTMDFTIARTISDNGTYNYVGYVNLVKDGEGNQLDNSVLNSTISTSYDSEGNPVINTIKQIGNTYYSYINPDVASEKEAYGDYAPNTIRVTNYAIDSDAILDYMTQQGDRTLSLSGDPNVRVFSEAQTGNTNIPNMQARAGVDNIMTLSTLSTISGYNNPENWATRVRQTQLFTIDSSEDNIERTFNLNGAKVKYGLSDSTNASRVANSGNGAALHVVSGNDVYDDEGTLVTEAAKSTVNISSYTANYTPEGGEEVTGYTSHPIFEGNIATNNGGAIYAVGEKATINVVENPDNVGLVDVTYIQNSAGENGGAVYIDTGATVNAELSNSTFTKNTAGENGGAIYNNAGVIKMGSEGSENIFYNNRAGATTSVTPSYDPETDTASYTYEQTLTESGGNGGAIANVNGGKLTIAGNTTFNRNIAGSLVSEAAGNVSNGGAIYNDSARLVVGSADTNTTFHYNEAFGNGGAVAAVNNNSKFLGNTTFTDNIATGNGAAIYAQGTEDSPTTVTLKGSQTFTDNLAEGKGGAIYGNKAVINIAATKGKTTTFSGNKQDVVYATEITDPATQAFDEDCGHVIDTTTGKHVITSSESNAIYLDGDATVNLKTAKSGNIVFDDKIASSDTSDNITNTINQNGNVYYNTDMSGYTGSFNLESGNAYFTHTDAVPFQNGDYKLNGGTLTAMKNGKIIPVHANSLDLSGTTKDNPAKFTIDLNLTDKKSDGFVLTNPTEGGYINVVDMGIEGDTTEKSIFYPIADGANVSTPLKRYDAEIYKYNVSGGQSGITFSRDRIHAPLAAPQVAVNARLAGQLDLFNDLLHRVDEIAEDRYFYKAAKENLYAADPDVLDDRHIDNGYTPYVNQMDGGSAWMKPGFTIEKINPKGYHKYNNTAYNTILGYEAPVATLRNGWDLINTVFAGYQGSRQSYDDMRNYQNGGTAGYMANLYHKNFFAGGVVMLGGSAVETTDKSNNNRDMNYGIFDVGASARIGYNVGLGKHWLFQPMYTMSYIYISGVDRHNHRGQHIDLKGTNTLQIAPGFKLVGNYGGWQPYLLFDYTWPCIAKTVANVNNIGIPDLKLRSYVEYGAGLRKNIGERFTGYAQAVMRNGGRTGVSFQGGLTFKF